MNLYYILLKFTIYFSKGTFDFDGDPSSLTVRVGSSSRDDGGTVVEVTEIHDHPKYNPKKLDNDFSILKLAEPLVFADEIQPIGLPTEKDVLEDGTLAFVSGYGDTKLPPSDEDSLLKGVQVPTVNAKVCKKAYKGFSKNMLCAGLGNFSNCF